ncbi:hypothetical protein [uncultured Rothia sp.]|uniref:hypothetical protein n=1 Tax=uncultured Rothia sp. TaxID=316088 RepID=UPI003217A6CA
MVASKNTLLKDSGFGSDSTYGNYNTYSDQGFAQQQEGAVNPLATNAGYVYSPASLPVSTKIQQSQWILAGSDLCFIAAIALGFVQNTHIAADLGHLSSGGIYCRWNLPSSHSLLSLRSCCLSDEPA